MTTDVTTTEETTTEGVTHQEEHILETAITIETDTTPETVTDAIPETTITAIIETVIETETEIETDTETVASIRLEIITKTENAMEKELKRIIEDSKKILKCRLIGKLISSSTECMNGTDSMIFRKNGIKKKGFYRFHRLIFIF